MLPRVKQSCDYMLPWLTVTACTILVAVLVVTVFYTIASFVFYFIYATLEANKEASVVIMSKWENNTIDCASEFISEFKKKGYIKSLLGIAYFYNYVFVYSWVEVACKAVYNQLFYSAVVHPVLCLGHGFFGFLWAICEMGFNQGPEAALEFATNKTTETSQWFIDETVAFWLSDDFSKNIVYIRVGFLLWLNVFMWVYIAVLCKRFIGFLLWTWEVTKEENDPVVVKRHERKKNDFFSDDD